MTQAARRRASSVEATVTTTSTIIAGLIVGAPNSTPTAVDAITTTSTIIAGAFGTSG